MSDSARTHQGLADALLQRAPLLAAVGLSLVTLLVVVPLPLLGLAPATNQAEAPMQTRDLRFEDRADGAVLVRDAVTEVPLAVFDVGQGGFVRGTLRALARWRRQEEMAQTIPFRLSAYPDGRLTLADPATGNHVELTAFGPTQRDTFARFLSATGPAR
jgi:putative photosynthetic complex assembly protein